MSTTAIGSGVRRQPAIVVRGLRRSFGQIDALGGPEGGPGLSFEVPRGIVMGLLGPDGAGKTTLIRILCTVLGADVGDAEVFGRSVRSEAAQVTPRIGYMSQQFSMYPDLSIAENVDYFATLRGVPRRVRRERAEQLLTGMGLAEFADRRAGALSGGMKQKLMLTTTLMHSPELLLLDEPTTGVDPVSRREFWRILGELNAAGTTVLVATPYMDEADRCHEIAFLDNGLITASGTPEAIKQSVAHELVEIAHPDRRAALAAVASVPGVDSPHLLGDLVRVFYIDDPRRREREQPLVQALAAAGLADAEVRHVPMDMEAAYTALAAAGPPHDEQHEQQHRRQHEHERPRASHEVST